MRLFYTEGVFGGVIIIIIAELASEYKCNGVQKSTQSLSY